MKPGFAPFGRRLKRGGTSVSPFFLLLAVVVSLILGACNAREREAKLELSRLGRSIDELREAKNEFKEEKLSALSKQPCQHHCLMQRTCVSAYQTHIQALRHLKEARELVLRSSAEDARALTLLTQAEEELKKARPLMQDCTRIQNDAQRTAGVP